MKDVAAPLANPRMAVPSAMTAAGVYGTLCRVGLPGIAGGTMDEAVVVVRPARAPTDSGIRGSPAAPP